MKIHIEYHERDGRPYGTAILRVHIGTDGRARNVEVAESSGHRNLDRSAMEVAWTARYRPFLRDGEAVEVSTLVPVTLQ